MAGSFLFAGGGSGGHVSPGLAVAERLLHHDPDAECHFICSQRPIDRVMMDRAGMSFDTMPACGLGRTPGSMLNWYRRHRETTAATRALLQSRRFDLVLTLGGYVAAPVARAAASEHVPVFLLNLDRVPGKANRAIAARTRNRLSAVEPIRVRGEWDIVGMPIRSSAMAPDTPEACRRTLGLDPDRKVLLLTGASQGARTLNQALPKIAADRPETFDEWQVLHLCGDDSIIDALTDAWAQSGVEATVLGFLHDMGHAWGAADACVSRAGASSVAEVHANAVPTIFLPYPFHRDDHQRLNAQPLVDAGGAGMVTDEIDVDRTAITLGDALSTLMQSEELRTSMRSTLKRNAWIDAADVVARRLLAAASENTARTA
jgi:UDP-N-acetylglucosamine--N-acetylmuramyl-(pentapeptide) pyrophosphoryl-undecaprenol N-acetylglucosamine transferase